MSAFETGSPQAFAAAIRELAAYEASKYKTSILFGTVVGIDNGAVNIETFDGYEIGGAQLVLSMFCKERTIHIPYDGSEKDDENADSHIHDEEEMLGTLTISHNPVGGCVITVTGDDNLTVTPSGPVPPTGCQIAFRHKHKIKPSLPTIKLWRGLIVGDIVIMSEMGNGQYYVHERASINGSNEVLNPKDEGMTE